MRETGSVQPKSLVTYINDHLAGSVAAVEMLDHLMKSHAAQPLASFFADLEREIKADQQILKQLLGNARRKESLFRKLAAWVTEKFARAKFKFAGEQVGGLGLVQALEMLALGIRGKELLWRALATSDWPPLRDVDLAKLEHRAVEQQARVEEKRLAAARAAFGSSAL
jgi:hypothetical protein